MIYEGLALSENVGGSGYIDATPVLGSITRTSEGNVYSNGHECFPVNFAGAPGLGAHIVCDMFKNNSSSCPTKVVPASVLQGDNQCYCGAAIGIKLTSSVIDLIASLLLRSTSIRPLITSPCTKIGFVAAFVARLFTKIESQGRPLVSKDIEYSG